MNQEEALGLLRERLEQIEPLKAFDQGYTPEHVRWMTSTLYLLDDIFGPGSRITHGFSNLRFYSTGTALTRVPEWKLQAELDRLNKEAYLRDLGIGQGLLEAAIDVLQRKGLAGAYQARDESAQANGIVRLLSALRSQLPPVLKLANLDEGLLRDTVETVLRAREFDYGRATERVEHGGETYTAHFVFHNLGAIMQVLLCNAQKPQPQVEAEIEKAIEAFGASYPNLILAVCDMGASADTAALQARFGASQHVLIEVIR